jgi:hypothetical protein
MAFMKTGTPVPFKQVAICPVCNQILSDEGICINCERLSQATV